MFMHMQGSPPGQIGERERRPCNGVIPRGSYIIRVACTLLHYYDVRRRSRWFQSTCRRLLHRPMHAHTVPLFIVADYCTMRVAD